MNGDVCGILILGAGIVSLFIALFVWRRRTVPETFWFALLAAATGLWALASSMEFLYDQMAVKIFWAKASGGPMVCAAPLWFLFALRQSKWDDDKFLRSLPFFWIVPFLILLSLLTNEGHGLYWRDIVPVAEPRGLQLLYFFGPIYWVGAAYSHILILAGAALAARNFLGYRPGLTGWILAAAAFLPWAVNAGFLAGTAPCRIDMTPAAFAVMLGLLFLVFLRFRILDMVPFARDMLFREMEDAVLVLDSRGRLVTMNPAAERALDVSAAGLGRAAAEILGAWPGLTEHCGASDEVEPSISIETTSGGKWFDVKISPLRGNAGRVKGKMLVFRDIGPRKHMESELVQYATMDALTDVFNRRMGLTIFEQQLRLSERNGTHLTICFVDINDLKSVNDNFGHAEGDFLIRCVAGALKESLRDSDVLCRLGGDEFLIILPDCTRIHAGSVFRRAEVRLKEMKQQSRKPYQFTVSKGYAEYAPESGVTADELLSLADEAMYRDKVGAKSGAAGDGAKT